jgi:hypothetical protein
MSARFRSPDATPPTGCYEYSCGGRTVTARTRSAIARAALELRAAAGLESAGDGFRYVEEYMCPFLPNGYCTEPSAVNPLELGDVKARTSSLFALPCVTGDVITERLAVCSTCPAHATRGFCMGECSGLLEWIYKGFAGRRVRLPADFGSGVCRHDAMFVVASASIHGLPPRAGEAYPGGCWRVKGGG